MKYLFIPLSLALASCNVVGTLPAPNMVADRATLDERAAIGVELAYQAAAQVALASGAAKTERVKAADRRAYAAVKAVRAAYSAGNASSYPTAAIAAHEAVAALLTAIKG
ncbi:hypothetical protein [Sphingomonas sp.]|uniref:hypothetical protein n=1 Tax=Sphingomonas sp. TaxID=28214 RepID=UPI0031D33BFF